jgi:hypothetical protein
MWKDKWKSGAKAVVQAVAKVISPSGTPNARRDSWYTANDHTREVNRRSRGRPHPHQGLLDEIDEAHAGRSRWIPRRRSWLS